MTTAIIAIADQNLVADLQTLLEEVDETEVIGITADSSDLRDLLSRQTPDVVFLHENLGPDPTLQIIRDIVAQHPEVAVLEVSGARTASAVIKAMEAGARGIIAVPFAFEDVQSRLQVAVEWANHMQSVVRSGRTQRTDRGRVIAVVGSKGGVGTTTLASHLAIDHASQHPDQRVCLVDLDVEKGDISAVLDVRQSVSVADVAKVATDMSVQTVTDALIHHESGLHLLLAPSDVREVDFVAPRALRAILEVLRHEFPVIIVDGGGHVSPVQAGLLEAADEVLVVTTADVLSVRAMRKRMLAWESLGVRAEATCKVVVNKFDKSGIFPDRAVAQLTTAETLATVIPLSTRTLEESMNSRDPRAVSEVGWWRIMTSIRRELALEARPQAAPAATPSKKGRRPRRQKAAAESGAIAIENLGIIPIGLTVLGLMWQLAVSGLTLAWSGYATQAGAREYALSGSTVKAKAAMNDVLPSTFQSGSTFVADGKKVTVTLRVPANIGGELGLPKTLSTTRTVVFEP